MVHSRDFLISSYLSPSRYQYISYFTLLYPEPNPFISGEVSDIDQCSINEQFDRLILLIPPYPSLLCHRFYSMFSGSLARSHRLQADGFIALDITSWQTPPKHPIQTSATPYGIKDGRSATDSILQKIVCMIHYGFQRQKHIQKHQHYCRK